MLLGFNPEAPNLFRLIRTSQGFTGETNIVMVPNADGRLSTTFLNASETFTGMQGQVVLAGTGGKIDCDFLNVAPGVPNNVVVYDEDGEIPIPNVTFTTFNNSMANVLIATSANGSLDRSFLETIRTNNGVSAQLIETNTTGHVDSSFIESIDAPDGNADMIVTTTTGGLLDNDFIDGTDTNDGRGGIPIVTSVGGGLSTDFLQTVNSNTTEADRFILTGAGGFIDRNFIRTVSSNPGTAGSIISTGASGFIDNGLIDFIFEADTSNQAASASMPVMTNSSGFVDASLIEITAAQTSQGMAGQVVSTTTDGMIDDSFIDSTDAFTGDDGVLVETNADGMVDNTLIETEQARIANTAGLIPATGSGGFISSTFLRTTTQVGQEGELITADADGMVSPLLIRSTQVTDSTTAAGELIATNADGTLDESFVPRSESRSGTAAALVSSTAGTGLIDISFLDVWQDGNTDADKIVTTEAGGMLSMDLFNTTVGPLPNTILSTNASGFVSVDTLNAVDDFEITTGANRPVMTDTDAMISTNLIRTIRTRSSTVAGGILASDQQGFLSPTFLRTTIGVGEEGDIFVAGADGMLDSTVVRSTEARTDMSAQGELVSLNSNAFIDTSLLETSETRVPDTSMVVVSRELDGRIDQGYLDKHVPGNTDELKVVVTGEGAFIDRAIVPTTESPAANAIVSTGDDTFIDSSLLNGVSASSSDADRPILTNADGVLDISLIPDGVLNAGVNIRNEMSPQAGVAVLTDAMGYIDNGFIRNRSTRSTTITENVGIFVTTNLFGFIDDAWVQGETQSSGNARRLMRTTTGGKLDSSFLNVAAANGNPGDLVTFDVGGVLNVATLNGVSTLPDENRANRPVLTGDSGLISSDLIPSSFAVSSIASPNGMAGELVQTSLGGTFNRGFIPTVSSISSTPADQANSILALNSAGFIDSALLNGTDVRIGGATGVGRPVITNSISEIDTGFLNSILQNPTTSNLVVLTEEGNQVASSRVQSISARPVTGFANLLVRTGDEGVLSNTLLNSSVSRDPDNATGRLITSGATGTIDLNWLQRQNTKPDSGDFVFAPRTDGFLDESFIDGVSSISGLQAGDSKFLLVTNAGISSDFTSPSIVANAEPVRTSQSGSRIMVTNGDNLLDLTYLRTANTLTSGANLVQTGTDGLINLNQISNAAVSADAPGGKLVRIAEGATTISQELLPAGFGAPSSITSPNGMANQFIVTQSNGLINQAFVQAVSDPTTLDEGDRGNLIYRTQASGRFHPDLMAYGAAAAFIPNARDLVPITNSQGHIDDNLLVTVDTFTASNPGQIIRTDSTTGMLNNNLVPFVTSNSGASAIVGSTADGTIDNSFISVIANAMSTLTDGANTIVSTGSTGLISSSLTLPGILADSVDARGDIPENGVRLLTSNAERFLDTSLIDTADTFTASAKVVLTGSEGFINRNQIQTTAVGGVEAAEGRIVRLGDSSRTLPTSLMPFPFAQIATGASNVIPLTDTTGNISVTYFNTITLSSGNSGLDRNRIVITNSQGTVDGSLTVGGVEAEAIDTFTETNGAGRIIKTNSEGIIPANLAPTSNNVVAATLLAGENLIKGTPIAFQIGAMGAPSAVGASSASDTVEGIAFADANMGEEVPIVVGGLLMDLDSSLFSGFSDTALTGELFLGDSNYVPSISETPVQGSIVQRLGRRVGNSIVIDIGRAARVA